MKVASYVRVSTEDQSLERQLEKNFNYIQRRFRIAEDIDDREKHAFGYGIGDIFVYEDKSTGTNTSREGYRELMEDAENGHIDAVAVSDITRISRSNRDLDRIADRLADCGTSLHLIESGMVIDPNSDDHFQRALFQLLGVFAELEAKMTQQRTREGIAARQNSDDEYHHGPAPLGFEKDSGELIEQADGTQRYDNVVSTLEMVQKGEVSKRSAADELNCARPTITRALEERLELYGL